MLSLTNNPLTKATLGKILTGCSLMSILTACGGGGGSDSHNNGQNTNTDTSTSSDCSSINDLTQALNCAAEPVLAFDTKTYQFSWNDIDGISFYRLLEDPDSGSGFTQVGTDIPSGTETIALSTSLYTRSNARYILQSCNDTSCIDSSTVNINEAYIDAIGYLKASNPGIEDEFGSSIAISADGNTLAVGAPKDDSSTAGINNTSTDDGSSNNSRAVYIFSRNSSSWSQQAYIKADNVSSSDGFGSTISLSQDGNSLAIGARLEDSNSTGISSTPNTDDSVSNSGAAYLYVRNGITWSHQAYIKADNAGAYNYFATSVDLSSDGNTLAVGANGEDSNSTGINSTPNDDGSANSSGAVYIFIRSASNWTQQAYIKSSNTEASDLFGDVLDLSDDGNTLAVGVRQDDSNTFGINTIPADDTSSLDSGAVYIFIRSSSSWSEQAYIKPSAADAYDEFGNSVALSSNGDILAVGAHLDDSSSTIISSIPATDNDADRAGAVYLFTRNNATWSEDTFIKPDNIRSWDGFGHAVSLSQDGNILAVGAPTENGTGTGINPVDDSFSIKSGSAYIFVRNNIIWSQQAYIKAKYNGAYDEFGTSISLSGDGNSLSIGANFEDSNTSGVNSTPDKSDGTGFNSGAVYLY